MDGGLPCALPGVRWPALVVPWISWQRHRHSAEMSGHAREVLRGELAEVSNRAGRSQRASMDAEMFGQGLKRRKADQASGNQFAAPASDDELMRQALAEVLRQNKSGERA